MEACARSNGNCCPRPLTGYIGWEVYRRPASLDRDGFLACKSVHQSRGGQRVGVVLGRDRSARSKICMVSTLVSIFSRVWINRIDQPDIIASPACGQLNRETKFSLSQSAPENLVFVRPVPSTRSISTLRLNLVLTHGIPSTFRDGVHLFFSSTAMGSVPSFVRSRNW